MTLRSVLCACVSVTAMVHQHYEPFRNMADGPNGPAAPRLSAEDSHQDCQGENSFLSLSKAHV